MRRIGIVTAMSLCVVSLAVTFTLDRPVTLQPDR